MSIDVHATDRIAMSQKERDVLKILHGVLQGERTQAEAARLLGFTVRHVRRLQRRLATEGDQALVHGLRGRPSNHRTDPAHRQKILEAYRQRYADFGPTFACEKLAEEGLLVVPQTLRRWLIDEGLWQGRRRRRHLCPCREVTQDLSRVAPANGRLRPQTGSHVPTVERQ